MAAAPGTVVEVYGGGGYNGGWGNRVVIDHGSNNYSTYNHLATGTITVAPGQIVARGQHLARMGSTGLSTAKHLHFEYEQGGRGSGYRVDPAPYYSTDLPGTEADENIPEKEDDMTPEQAGQLKAVYDALFKQTPTSRGEKAGVLSMTNAVYDAQFLEEGTSRGTPGGTLVNDRITLAKLDAIIEHFGIEVPGEPEASDAADGDK